MENQALTGCPSIDNKALPDEEREAIRDIKKVYKSISFSSKEKEVLRAQETIAKIYKRKTYSFEFLHRRYYYLTAYETTFSTQISFLFGTAATVAIAVVSKNLFLSMGLSNLLSLILCSCSGLLMALFFAFRGLYIGIAMGSLVAPVERAYLYPFELMCVKEQLREHEITLP